MTIHAALYTYLALILYILNIFASLQCLYFLFIFFYV